jgi:hypothetical protein
MPAAADRVNELFIFFSSPFLPGTILFISVEQRAHSITLVRKLPCPQNKKIAVFACMSGTDGENKL